MHEYDTKYIESQTHPTDDEYKFGRGHNLYMKETFDRLQENGQSKSKKEDTVEKGAFIAVQINRLSLQNSNPNSYQLIRRDEKRT
jgi:hypothetical protein